MSIYVHTYKEYIYIHIYTNKKRRAVAGVYHLSIYIYILDMSIYVHTYKECIYIFIYTYISIHVYRIKSAALSLAK